MIRDNPSGRLTITKIYAHKTKAPKYRNEVPKNVNKHKIHGRIEGDKQPNNS